MKFLQKSLDTLSKRITLGFWVLSFVLAAGQCYLILYSWEQGIAALEQRLNNELGYTLAIELEPVLSQGYHSRELQIALNRLVEINPRIDIFLLDSEGRVRARSNEEIQESTDTPVFDISRIETFLKFQANRPPPVLPNPYYFDRLTAFSAARIDAPEPGYVLALLHGELFRIAEKGVKIKYLILGGIITSIGFFLLMATFGTFLFRTITRRFSAMVNDVGRIAEGEFDVAIDARGSDEVARLGAAINTMSETIVGSLKSTQQADRERRELLAMVAHDLGGPLAAIQGTMDLLLADSQLQELPSVQTRLQAVRSNTQRLTGMTKELSQLSSLENPDTTLSEDEFSLLELVQDDIIPRLAQLASEQNVNLKLSTTEALPPVRADVELIDRVLKNLVENGIRYNRSGGEVEISISKQRSTGTESETDNGAGTEVLQVVVRNDGPGIAAKELPHIFDRFYRGTQDGKRRTAGTGLGLAIVKRALELHGTTIAVRSNPDLGTEFSFRLPLASAST